MPSLSESIAMEISVLRYYCFSCAIICNILLANFALGQSGAIYDTCEARPGRFDFAHFCAFRTIFLKKKQLNDFIYIFDRQLCGISRWVH